jgi:hypothetical protein
VLELKERLFGPKRTILPMKRVEYQIADLFLSHTHTEVSYMWPWAELTVSLVHSPKVEVSVAFPGVVELVAICNLG